MRSGRSVLGVVAGVLLGLGVVVLAGPGLNPAATWGNFSSLSPEQATYTSMKTVTTMTSTGVPRAAIGSNTTVSNSTDGQGERYFLFWAGSSAVVPASHLDGLAQQPISLTGFVLLPIFAAFLLGLALYRASKGRSEEESPESA
jgi:hypothetical protein